MFTANFNVKPLPKSSDNMIKRASANHIYAQSLIDNGDKHYNRSALYERNTPAALLHKQEFAEILR